MGVPSKRGQHRQADIHFAHVEMRLRNHLFEGDSAMNLFNTNVKCALCNAQLALWNAHTCMRCGKKMCSHHCHLLRMSHSYVLSSVCVHCFDGRATFPYASSLSRQREHARI